MPPPSTSTLALTRACAVPFLRPDRRPDGGSIEMLCESSGAGLEADRSTVFPLLAGGRFIVRRRVQDRALATSIPNLRVRDHSNDPISWGSAVREPPYLASREA